jgi:molybdenum cofactor biosynthesis protein B
MPDDDHSRNPPGTHSHHAGDVDSVTFGLLTVSSSRTLERDESGDALVEAVEAAGHTIHVRDIVSDDEEVIVNRVEEIVDRGVDAVVTTGGTGLTADDVTPDAIEPLFDRRIPGFGERFRARSFEEVGPHGMLSRAVAGVVGDTAVFCLPGSDKAARFGVRELVIPVAGHVVGLLRDSGHRNGEHARKGRDHAEHGLESPTEDIDD